jgi:hypothetical protein
MPRPPGTIPTRRNRCRRRPRAYEDPYNREAAIGVTERALPKDHKKDDFAATWAQEVQYDTPEHGEDASYTLEFRLART